MERFRAGECPCCGHHNNWNDTIGPNTVSDSDSNTDDTDTDDDLHFNPAVFDDDNTPHNYFNDDDDDNQPNGAGITA